MVQVLPLVFLTGIAFNRTTIAVSYPLFSSLRKSVTNAFAWAKTHGKIRRNEVKGCDEAQLIIDDEFEVKDVEGESQSQTARVDIEESF